LVTRTDDSGANFFADYFGDFAYLQSTQVRRVSDYVLLGPPGRTFYASATPLQGLVHTEGKSPDGGTWRRWTAKDVPRLVPEPSMPGYSEVLAYVHVSTYKTWDDVGRFYWGLVKDQLRVTDDIRAVAQEAVKGIPESDEAARIRAVYDFVVSRTRYVALEFGINSFKPYPVETILARRFGDCKDKASLMHAMLEALGIDSRLTLLRMKRLGGIDEAPASLAVFNHAILYVPKHKLFLDGTAEFHGSAELPGDDSGAEVLVVEPGGGSKFFRTPDATPADNLDETRIAARLEPDGTAAVQVKGSARGAWTAELRRIFEPADERRGGGWGGDAESRGPLGEGLRPARHRAAVRDADHRDRHRLRVPEGPWAPVRALRSAAELRRGLCPALEAVPAAAAAARAAHDDRIARRAAAGLDRLAAGGCAGNGPAGSVRDRLYQGRRQDRRAPDAHAERRRAPAGRLCRLSRLPRPP
jgi:hypothetical protein